MTLGGTLVLSYFEGAGGAVCSYQRQGKYWIPAVKAAVEISRGDAAKGLDALQGTQSYEAGQPLPLSPIGIMYPVYIRGYAFQILYAWPNWTSRSVESLNRSAICHACRP